jgi:hypothetical protein
MRIVADPRCLVRIPNPDFYPSRIPDPTAATIEEGEKNMLVLRFFVAKSSEKYGFGIRDPRFGSGNNLYWIPDKGVKKPADPGFATLKRKRQLSLCLSTHPARKITCDTVPKE